MTALPHMTGAIAASLVALVLAAPLPAVADDSSCYVNWPWMLSNGCEPELSSSSYPSYPDDDSGYPDDDDDSGYPDDDDSGYPDDDDDSGYPDDASDFGDLGEV